MMITSSTTATCATSEVAEAWGEASPVGHSPSSGRPERARAGRRASRNPRQRDSQRTSRRKEYGAPAGIAVRLRAGRIELRNARQRGSHSTSKRGAGVMADRAAPVLREGDFNLVAGPRPGIPNGVARQFQNRDRVHQDRRDAPGLDVLLHVHYYVVLVQVDDIQRVPHEEGVYAVAGHDPQSLAESELHGLGAQQAAQAAQVRIRGTQVRGQESLPSVVER